MKKFICLMLIIFLPFVVFAVAETIPANVPPEIIKPNDHTAVNNNPPSKLTFEQQADAALSTAIQQRLTGNPQLKGKLAYIKIKAVEGWVILQGTARSEEDRANIVHQVENMAGVDNVDNQVMIASE